MTSSVAIAILDLPDEEKIAGGCKLRIIHEDKHHSMPKDDKKEHFKTLGIENGSSDCTLCLCFGVVFNFRVNNLLLVINRFFLISPILVTRMILWFFSTTKCS